jgi:acetylglutamate kinase
MLTFWMNAAFEVLEVSIATSNQYAVPVVSPVITSVQAKVLTALDALDVAGRISASAPSPNLVPVTAVPFVGAVMVP